MNENKNWKFVLEWDECKLYVEEVKRLIEEEGLTEEQASDKAANSDYSIYWDDLLINLSDEMDNIARRNKYFGYWIAEVTNFGWLNRDGMKEFKATDSSDFLAEILPKTDCTFQIFRKANELKIRCWHHDSPTGNEYYYIRPMTAKEVEKYRGF